jgi:hypothetical protein
VSVQLAIHPFETLMNDRTGRHEQPISGAARQDDHPIGGR